MAGAGKGGLLSIFPLQLSATQPPTGDSVPHVAPAASVKIHNRWVAEIETVPRSGDQLPAILSAADDRNLVLSAIKGSADQPSSPNFQVMPLARLR